ncbi:unnamed protein product [Auanema sp. JU1783]|nr:unnamed protein product [Auanema sp. JU1783]
MEIAERTPSATEPRKEQGQQPPEGKQLDIKLETLEDSESEESIPPKDSSHESSEHSDLEIDTGTSEQQTTTDQPNQKKTTPESEKTKEKSATIWTQRPMDNRQERKMDKTNEQLWIKQLPNIMETAKKKLEERKNLTCAPPRRESAFKNFLILACAISIIPTTRSAPYVYCNGTHLTLNAEKQQGILCIDTDCQKIGAETESPKVMEIEAKSHNNMITVKLITEEGTEITRCGGNNICHKTKFMTRNLLGNPHCWPLGAQLSAFIYITLFFSILLPLIRYMATSTKNSRIAKSANKKWKQTKEMAKNLKQLTNAQQLAKLEQKEWNSQKPLNKEWKFENSTIWNTQIEETTNPEPIYDTVEPINSRNDEGKLIRNLKRKSDSPRNATRSKIPKQTAYMSTLVIMGVWSLGHGCQDTHTRYITELKCDNRTHCFYQFGREVMFNTLTSKICVQMMHNNAAIGSIEIEKMNSTLKCVKEHLHYSRITEPIVETYNRCPYAGSCQGDNCEELTKHAYLEEFNHTYQYHGEAACTKACVGLFCGCGIFFKSGCSFYRLYHKPVTEEIFEIFRCAEFYNEVIFKINIIIKKQLTTQYIKMKPYQKVRTPFLNATVVSITNQYSPITSNRFARTENRTIMLDNHDEFMMKCQTKSEARDNQTACLLPDKCHCRNHLEKAYCECPTNAIRKHEKQMLPFATSSIELKDYGKTIVAVQKTDEILFFMESNLLMESAAMNLDYPCVPAFTNITGCYDCPEGAKISINCMATVDSWITIQCDEHIRSIECAPSNPSTMITMYFNEATVSQQCFTKCANQRKEFTISGVLQYHELEDDMSTAAQQEIDWTRLPDLNPLGSVIINRWKTSTLLTGASVVTTLVSYAFGAQALTITSKPILWITSQTATLIWRMLAVLIKAII